MGGPKEFKPAPVPDFPKALNFEECNNDCASCDREYEPNIVKSIDMEMPLYGGVMPFSVHLGCLTGKSDWVHDVTAEENSPAARVASVLALHVNELEKQDRVVLSNISVEASTRTKHNTGTEYGFVVLEVVDSNFI